MAANEVTPGPAMRYVVANVLRLRGDRNWSQAKLSERLTEVGRPIRATGLHRLETGKRRVDVDDLVGLALAFKVSPITLLLPPVAEGDIELSDEVVADARAAWDWMQARRPLDPADSEDEYEVVDFLRRALPRGIRNRYPATAAGRELMLEEHPNMKQRTVAEILEERDG